LSAPGASVVGYYGESISKRKIEEQKRPNCMYLIAAVPGEVAGAGAG
jgi:hypothetical protein